MARNCPRHAGGKRPARSSDAPIIQKAALFAGAKSARMQCTSQLTLVPLASVNPGSVPRAEDWKEKDESSKLNRTQGKMRKMPVNIGGLTSTTDRCLTFSGVVHTPQTPLTKLPGTSGDSIANSKKLREMIWN